MKGGAPVGPVLRGLLPGVRIDSFGLRGNAFLVVLVACHRTVFWAAIGLACELHGLPIVAETASGWCRCWTGLLGQGPRCLESGPAT